MRQERILRNEVAKPSPPLSALQSHAGEGYLKRQCLEYEVNEGTAQETQDVFVAMSTSFLHDVLLLPIFFRSS
jgi:hypothetical protein